MINLKVDEAYAFDYLSILYIKRNYSKEALNNWVCCGDFLEDQIGSDLYKLIINSEEYAFMISSNQKTFNMVDLAKEDKCSAKDVDTCNYERYKAKVKLQNKFFKQSVSEMKIGYEK
jgi:predicted transcriptional regulator